MVQNSPIIRVISDVISPVLCGVALSCKKINPSSKSSGRFFRIAGLSTFEYTPCSTPLTVLQAGSLLVVRTPRISYAKIIRISYFDCTHRNFAGRGELGVCHTADCLFSSGSYDLTHVSSVATILDLKFSPSVLYHDRLAVATSKRR